MKALCMLLVPALALLSLKIESTYNEVNPVLHHYINSKTYNHWDLVVRDESLNYPRNCHSIKVSLGNPQQNLSLALDTQSSYVSVNKSGCKNGYCTSLKFNQDNSSTFTDTYQTKTISYFLGEATGRQAYDTLRGDGIELPSMPFILVDSDTFDSIPSGVAGLGYDEYGYSFITLLKDRKVIDIKSFSLLLRNPIDESLDIPESLLIGNTSIDCSRQDGKFEYIKLDNSNGNWEVPCDSTEFGGVSYEHAQTAKIDLGSTLFIGPKALVMNILDTLLNNYNCRLNGDIVCDCSKSYPSLILDLAGHKFLIDSNDYLSKSNGYCYPLFGYNNIDFWILGDIFIKKYYLEFNFDKKVIGFYKNKETYLTKPENDRIPLYNISIKESGVNKWVIIGVVLGGVVFSIAFSLFLIMKYKVKIWVCVCCCPE